MADRLSFALDSGAVALPETGTIAVIGPPVAYGLGALPKGRVVVVQGFRPAWEYFESLGYAVTTEVPADAAMALIVVPRAKAAARGLVAAAAGTPILLDGAKTDGIDSLLRDLRRRADVGAVIAKAHGKVAVVNASPEAVADWRAEPVQTSDWWVMPGLFSADGPDPASAALASALPEAMPGAVADLGAGWGYLSAAVLAREGVTACHLVEAEADGIAMARRNVADPRAQFHWADATRWTPTAPVDHVVMNPPFHAGRAADPALGQAFIAAAAQMLTPRGALWMVANRQLPYEAALAELFQEVTALPAPAGFKLTRAAKPARKTGPRHRR